MRKKRLIVALFLLLVMMFTMFRLSSHKSYAVTPENIGEFAPADVDSFAWLTDRADEFTAKFITTYEAEGWTQPGNSTVKVVEFDRQRHALMQVYGTGTDFEGAILFNDISSNHPIIIEDEAVLVHLESLLDESDTNLKGVLLDVIESNGDTYYVTDRRNDDGIFKLVDDLPVYHNFRIGIGVGTYGDVMWNDYAKAYKFGVNNGIRLGLPTGAVARYDYTTKDLNDNGTYAAGDPTPTSIKTYTKQPFENGWIIQARLQTRNENGSLGGQHKNFYPAVPILNDMYTLVHDLSDNDTLNVTGAPTSLEYTLPNGVRVQNFEYGYVKLADGAVEFIEDKVVDSQGTEMHRRVGATYPNWQDVLGRGLGWEVLRTNENFRNTFGQIIRDGKIDNPLREPSLEGNAPNSGLWFGFGGGVDRQALGFANIFIYQKAWYLGAFELAAAFNNPPLLVDAQNNIGRPISQYVEFDNTTYQWFEGGFVFIHNSRENRAAGGLHVIYNDEFEDWLGTHESVEDKIRSITFEVKFVDADDNEISVEQVAWDTLADGVAPTAPTKEGYDFAGWLPDIETTPIIEDTTFKADYALNMGTPETGKIGYLNFDIKEESGTFWYEDETNVITLDIPALFHAWRHGRDNAQDALNLGGLPLYADDNNLVTTLWHFVLEEGVVTKNPTIGKVPDGVTSLKSFRAVVNINEAVQKIISDSFGDAYIFTWDRLGHNLGLPVGVTTSQVRTAETDIFATANTDTFTVLIQEFENGFIFQEEYTHAAFPLFGDMYDEWLRLGGLNGETALGTPMGLPVEFEGVTYQNFTNGYLSYDGTDFEATYGVVKVDNKGRELDGRAGLTEGRNNIRLGHPNFETEMLRAYEAYMVAFTQALDAGYSLNEVGNAAKFIHEWGGNGLSNSFKNSGSNSNVWGLSEHLNIVLKSPDHEAYIIVDEFLTKYAEDGMRSALGFPVSNVFELEVTVDSEGNVYEAGEITLTVKFQNFEGGYVRVYLYKDAVITEEFFEGNVNELGEFVAEDETLPLQPFAITPDEPADTTELEAKIAELEAKLAGVNPLLPSDDITQLPKENKYAPKALLDEIEAEITRIEALIAGGEMTEEDVLTEMDTLDDLLLDLENSTVNGQFEEDSDPDPDPDPDPDDEEEKSEGLSTGAIIAIVVASLAVVGAGVFALFKFVIKKRV